MAARITARDIARRMGKSEKDVLFQLQSLGADITDPEQVIEPDAIQALITGKRIGKGRSPIVVHRSPTPTPTKPPVSTVHEPPPVHPARPVVTTKSPQDQTTADLLFTLRQHLLRESQQASNEVFIVHGHDQIKHEVAGFISSLSLIPIMLDEKPNRGQTIIEKLEHHAYTPFAVVLLTPDDEGRKKGDASLKSRARQNVIMELGYFLGSLGRHRVCALYVPGVELPSDVHGLLYVELDASGGWKYRLQKELVAASLPLRLPS